MGEHRAQLALGKFNKTPFNKQKRSKNTDKKSRDDSVNGNWYHFTNGLIRIEYPGLVKDIYRAIYTLGGMDGIHLPLNDHRYRLMLRFHPDNPYNKPVAADKDQHPGILIRIQEIKRNNDTNYKYDVVGVTSVNFLFNRLCDFQYLPVVQKENSEEVEYIPDKVIPTVVPDLKWFFSKEIAEQQTLFLPQCFTRFDTPTDHLHLEAGERFTLDADARKDYSKNNTNVRRKGSRKAAAKIVNFQHPNYEIPTEPSSGTKEMLKGWLNRDQCKIIKKMFEEQPIWVKESLYQKSGIKEDSLKRLLPAFAYFCKGGPWRLTWIRLGYDPTKDFSSRIYQTLDYRIRTSEGIKMKVSAKRSMYTKMLGLVAPSPTGERCFILRPGFIPPARQVIYQYCNLEVPEIQEMLQRLPKPPTAKYNPKNGWLPLYFTEQCRKLVNDCVMATVQKVLLEENRKDQDILDSMIKDESDKPTTYCSQMLSNIRKGIYTSVNVFPLGGTEESENTENGAEVMDVDSNNENYEENYLDYVINSIPEKMAQDSDEEILSSGSDIDIEEVNDVISSGS